MALSAVNLLSLAEVVESKDQVLIRSFIHMKDQGEQLSGKGINVGEINDIYDLICDLKECDLDAKYYNNFFLGSKLPQIDKQFDLLKFGANKILNVEFKKQQPKHKATKEEPKQKQLKKNKYYLDFFGMEVSLYTYVVSEKKLYRLNQVINELEETTMNQLVDDMKFIGDDDDKFQNLDASKYLVSPFDNPDKFLADQYYLTNLQSMRKNELFLSDNDVHVISGAAGTGKTLLLYDIAKNLIDDDKKVQIVHSANLNPGQEYLNEHGFNITPIKHWENIKFDDYDYILFDEMQRLSTMQLNQIIKKSRFFGKQLIFSGDAVQILNYSEAKDSAATSIELMEDVAKYSLDGKIRSNPEISAFTKKLFNLDAATSYMGRFDNIQLEYFLTINHAITFLETAETDGYQVISFTPSRSNIEHVSDVTTLHAMVPHSVIGREFDNVAIVITPDFFYTSGKQLSFHDDGGYTYPAVRNLFQAVTRARNRLMIAVVNNPEVYKTIAKLLIDQNEHGDGTN